MGEYQWTTVSLLPYTGPAVPCYAVNVDNMRQAGQGHSGIPN